MKITYDPEVDAMYIRFKDVKVTTQHITADIAVDYDADGLLAGIEILDVSKQIGDKSAFRQIVVEDVALAHHE